MMRETLFPLTQVQRSRYRKPGQSSANDLTRLILRWARSRGYFASRINNVGIYDSKTGRYRKSHTKQGFPDIVIIGPFGRFYGIEVKVGRDVLSDAQIRCAKEIRAAGGEYVVARSVNDVNKAMTVDCKQQ
ncbi:MAG TPA: VRR-NUC domain-containing protein [Desulfobacteraceae bacterium]|nr:VRR-NUC domain-containing protein [Desulfobacteraceae bacterium]HRW94557.1 VRR-NUC domain-containing protein [Bacteroidales bacterium]